jgi:hypothetical protein
MTASRLRERLAHPFTIGGWYALPNARADAAAAELYGKGGTNW